MATIEINEIASTDGVTSADLAVSEDSGLRHVVNVRLLTGAGGAIGAAPLFPWVRYTGLISMATHPKGVAVVIGWLFAALLIYAASRASRSTLSVKLAVCAASACVLSAITGVFVIAGCNAHNTLFERAQPGLGVYLLLAGAAAGIVGLVRNQCRKM